MGNSFLIDNGMKGLVSIIIPCYNDGRYIEQAIQSILDQTYSNREIIVIDDGSNNETKNILKDLDQKIDLLITQENQGTSAARNIGISYAKGKFILPLDSDDYFEPDFIEKSVNILEKDSRVGLVTCHAHIIKDDNITGEIISVGGQAKDMLIRNGVLANSLFRKKVWEDVSGYDEKMVQGYEDWDFNISITQKGWQVYVIDEFLFNYRLKKKSRNTFANFSHKYDLLTYINLKHQDTFVNNYSENIQNLFSQMEKIEKEKIRIENSLSNRLGMVILKPIRLIRSILNKNSPSY
ncbi:glycosyltransferase family A protein [Christiangramia sp.]|uniref:glycosyltransferase family 2 protein n=1 Tax=Christiangramia sp. TaxID=1931228 RepID=UPI00260DACDB|nr:glycosyltransferase family A protein [Christiangramia sp.]